MKNYLFLTKIRGGKVTWKRELLCQGFEISRFFIKIYSLVPNGVNFANHVHFYLKKKCLTVMESEIPISGFFCKNMTFQL